MIIRKYTCKRCSIKFSSNKKLHEHVREHYTKKLIVASKATSIAILIAILEEALIAASKVALNASKKQS